MTNVKESIHDRIERQRQEEIDRNMTSLIKLSDGVFILTAPFALAYKFIKRPFSKRKDTSSQKEVTAYDQVSDVAWKLTKGAGKLIKFDLDNEPFQYTNTKEYADKVEQENALKEQIPLEEVEQYVRENFEDGYGPSHLSKVARLSYARDEIYKERFQK